MAQAAHDLTVNFGTLKLTQRTTDQHLEHKEITPTWKCSAHGAPNRRRHITTLQKNVSPSQKHCPWINGDWSINIVCAQDVSAQITTTRIVPLTLHPAKNVITLIIEPWDAGPKKPSHSIDFAETRIDIIPKTCLTQKARSSNQDSWSTYPYNRKEEQNQINATRRVWHPSTQAATQESCCKLKTDWHAQLRNCQSSSFKEPSDFYPLTLSPWLDIHYLY